MTIANEVQRGGGGRGRVRVSTGNREGQESDERNRNRSHNKAIGHHKELERSIKPGYSAAERQYPTEESGRLPICLGKPSDAAGTPTMKT